MGERDNRIEKIEIEFFRRSRMRFEGLDENSEWGSVVSTRREKLTLDRASGTISMERDLGSGRSVEAKYVFEGEVTRLLDSYYPEYLFAHPGEEREDALYDPDEERRYRIELTFTEGGRTLEGRFDADCLPPDYPNFVSDIQHMMLLLDYSQMLGADFYKAHPRHKGELIFCSVLFHENEHGYWYLSPLEGLNMGDFVVVPVGDDMREKVGVVEKVEFRKPEDAPFPMDRLKSVLRRCTDEEAERIEGGDESDGEPLKNMTVEEWRELHSDLNVDAILAQALAGAWNQTDWLYEQVLEDPARKEEYEQWSAYEDELVGLVAERTGEDMGRFEDSDEGTIEFLKPFMERNGFVNFDYVWYRRGEEILEYLPEEDEDDG